ncbi:hypothetical protein REPUB_Repub17cG0076800 [Reevesia pubescens]
MVAIQPFILLSQLYSSVKDRTQVVRELECSLLSLGGRVKDEQISLIINAGLLNRQSINPSMYWFAVLNIGSILKGLFQVYWASMIERQYGWFYFAKMGRMSVIDVLITYVPEVVRILCIREGTKELLSLLNRRRYEEMMLAPLEKKCLQLSPLDMDFTFVTRLDLVISKLPLHQLT